MRNKLFHWMWKLMQPILFEVLLPGGPFGHLYDPVVSRGDLVVMLIAVFLTAPSDRKRDSEPGTR
jgi:hypothetical protein